MKRLFKAEADGLVGFVFIIDENEHECKHNSKDKAKAIMNQIANDWLVVSEINEKNDLPDNWKPHRIPFGQGEKTFSIDEILHSQRDLKLKSEKLAQKLRDMGHNLDDKFEEDLLRALDKV